MEQINPTIEMPKEAPLPAEVSQADKEKFFKCVLSDQPYTETVELFGGQMVVGFKSMTVQENNDVVAQIVVDQSDGVAKENDAYYITLATYRLAQCLTTIDGVAVKIPSKESFLKDIGSTDTYVAHRAKTFKTWSTFKLSAFLDAFRTFEAKLIKLTSEVQVRNFWTAGASEP